MRASENPITREGGFALVVTLSLLILLTIIAVGLLSLSSISLRGSAQGSAQAEARANARLALVLAIGELQKSTGTDMRITAPADIIDAGNPSLTGVWKSWEGSDHEVSGNLSGRPKKPDYVSKKTGAAGGGRFVSWLVSGATDKKAPGDAAGLVLKTASPTSVPLVSTGSLQPGDLREVNVDPVSVSGGGKYAWWVSGENQKARIPKPYDAKADTVSGWSEVQQTHAVADPTTFELDPLLTDPSPSGKAFTLATADLMAKPGANAIPHKSFHDLSASSVGLLTNVATGGWRKDLSLLTEKWTDQPLDDLALFQLTPTEHAKFTRPVKPANASDVTTVHRPQYSLFYHWSDYGPNTNSIFYDAGAVSSWHSLATFATLYRDTSRVSTTPSGGLSMPVQTWAYKSAINTYFGLHTTRFFPMLTRYQFVFSHYAIPSPDVPGMLIPCVLYTPVFTLWNPHNYDLVVNQAINLRIDFPVPLALKYTIGGTEYDYHSFQWADSPYGAPSPAHAIANNWQVNYAFPSPIILKPGQTLVCSPKAGVNPTEFNRVPTGNNNGIMAVTLDRGLRMVGGLFCRLDQVIDPQTHLPAKVGMSAGTSISAAAKFDAARGGGVGMKAQWALGAMNTNTSNAIVAGRYTKAEADTLYPPIPKDQLASTTLGECNGNPTPFMSIVFGSRIASNSISPTKGMVQNNPLIYTSATGVAQNELLNGRTNKIFPGATNLINSPWDFSFVPHQTGPGSSQFPEADSTTNAGYIISGFSKADGISNCVISDFPVRPLASLVELTNWHIRGMNPIPPFVMNIIGNSEACPLLPPDGIVRILGNNAANGRDNLQQDDSYCANHILFDDWFFSSIAPEPTAFGSSGRALEGNYTDFLTGSDPLANRAYRPILADATNDPVAAKKTYDDEVAPTDSWKRIASRLEVDGMFNVNSTSEKAWRALLGHARNQKIPHFTNSGGSMAVSAKTDHAFPRTSVAGDKQAGEATSGTYFASTEFVGYRVLDDAFLDSLATEVVKQVRLRGPFLSLSEFLNRQLSTDKELAVAGAIQAALNQVAKTSSTNPFQTIENESAVSAADPPGNDDYLFREAAVGASTYGVPGWTRQADVLRQLAPILSARDDTFTIRTYGDARSKDGKTILAKAWCEATVRRGREFSDPGDKPDITTAPVIPANQTYGRKYEIISFRWLSAGEI